MDTPVSRLVILSLTGLAALALLGLVTLSYFGSVDESTRNILGNVAVASVGAIAGILSQRRGGE